MKRKSPSRQRRATNRGLTLGRKWAEKINAIEGLHLTPAAEQRAAEFERRKLSPAQRREAILQAYRQARP